MGGFISSLKSYEERVLRKGLKTRSTFVLSFDSFFYASTPYFLCRLSRVYSPLALEVLLPFTLSVHSLDLLSV